MRLLYDFADVGDETGYDRFFDDRESFGVGENGMALRGSNAEFRVDW